MDIKEINEAIRACDDTIDLINSGMKKLGSARGWGIYDTFFDGGLFSSLIKHGKINDASKIFNKINNQLVVLQKELSDINIDFVKYDNLSSLNTFLDIVFDNVFSDFITQKNINDNLDKLKFLKRDIEKVRSEVINIKKELN